MRSVRNIALGLAAVACTLGAVATPAFAKREKMVFGEFQASVVGKTLSASEPGTLRMAKEGEVRLTGLQLGNYRFGPVDEATGEVNYEEPCARQPKITGTVTAEKSSSLTTKIEFRKCVSRIEAGSVVRQKYTSFTLGVTFRSNYSAEVGELEVEKATVDFNGGLGKQCEVEIPQQTVPYKMNPEREYEVATYAADNEEPIENWEKSRKLKEEYPGDVKQRLEIELTEKFKGLRSYVAQGHGCTNKKGEESGKLVTEEGPYKGMIEFDNGHIYADIEGLEVEGGQLTFVPPAA
jgi:hypothetical protein